MGSRKRITCGNLHSHRNRLLSACRFCHVNSLANTHHRESNKCAKHKISYHRPTILTTGSVTIHTLESY